MTTNILQGTLILADAPSFINNSSIAQYDDYETVTNKLQTQINNTATNLLVPNTFTNFSTSSQVASGDDYGTAISELQGQLNRGGNLLYQGVTPTSGGSQTMPNSFSGLWLTATDTIDTFTITLKSSPNDGEVVWITSDNAITSLILFANTGQTLDSTISSFDASQVIGLRYSSAYSTWRIIYSSNQNSVSAIVEQSDQITLTNLGQWYDITNITLTTGKWLVFGTISLPVITTANYSTIPSYTYTTYGALNNIPGNDSTNIINGYNCSYSNVSGMAPNDNSNTGDEDRFWTSTQNVVYIVNVSGSFENIYLKASYIGGDFQATFYAYGSINAIRIGN